MSLKNTQEVGDINWKVYIDVRSTTAVNRHGVKLSMFFLCLKICSALPRVQLCVKVSFETWWFSQGPATHLQPPCLWLKCTSVYSVNPNQNCQPWKIFIGFVAKKINIARGTTDPGYWVYNLNNVSEIILAEKVYSSCGLNTLGPLCLWQCFQFFPKPFFQLFLLFQFSLALVPILATREHYMH